MLTKNIIIIFIFLRVSHHTKQNPQDKSSLDQNSKLYTYLI